MDDESKRRIAASLDKPLDPKRDRQLIDTLEKDPQAKAWAEGLKTVDNALRRWPPPARSANEWEDFAARLEKRLGESPWEAGSRGSDSFDPLAPPLLEGDDGEASHVEQRSMGSPDKNDDDDLEALAALTRSSTAPTSLAPPPKPVSAGPSLHDDAMDESSGIVDMKQLAEIALKQPAQPATGALAPTPADTNGRTDAAAVMAGEKVTAREPAKGAVPPTTAAAEAKSAKAATPVDAAPAKPAPAEKKGGAGWVLWLTPVIAAAAVGGFFFLKNNSAQAPTNAAANESSEQREAPSAAAAPAAQPATTPPPPPAAPAPTVAMNEPQQPAAPAAGESAAAPAPAAPAEPAPNAAPTIGSAGAGGGAGLVARNEAPPADEGGAERHARPAASARSTVAAADTTSAGHATDGDQPAATTRGARSGSGSAPSGGAATATSTTTVAAAAPARTAPPPPAAAAPATGATGGARSMDELMATAVGGSHGATTAAANLGSGGGGAAAATQGSDALPDRPSRAQVTATMTPLSPAVRACTQGQTGVATVAMVIHNDGTVQSASVSGPFSGDANNCIAGVVRRAHFPAFSRPSVPIVYPFSIQPPRPGAQ